MADLEVRNWFGDIQSHPKALAEANSVEDIIGVLKNPLKYPSPVRAVGSNHSTARCGVADGGTVVMMKMNRILSLTAESVTAQAGALYIDVAKELEKQGLQFYVNTEIGNLTVGSAACAGTKDASFPGEFGQVGSYVTAVKMVLPSGQLLEVTEDQPDLLRQVRSSYGTFGIVYEATIRVRPIQPMAVRHETFSLEEFVAQLDALKARNESLMFYMFPHENVVTVEFRRYNPGAAGPPERHVWELRNFVWAVAGPLLCHEVEERNPVPAVRYAVIDGFNAMMRFKLTHLIHSDNTVATDEIIRYPTVSNNSRYTFSFWAFPEERYPTVLPEYFRFCRDYYTRRGYRSNMLTVGYRIAQDQNSLLSYSFDGTIMTIDPVSTANPGWYDFLAAYNEFCAGRGAVPLLNQSYGLTRAQLENALGERLTCFRQARKRFDPDGRLLSDYFRDLLAE